MTDWRISVRKNPEEVAKLVGADRADLERSPFQRAAWLETWFGSFVGQKPTEICAATIEDAETGEPVFVLPLMVEHRGGVARLKAWDAGVSDYNGPVMSKSFAPSSGEMRKLWHDMLGKLPKADLIEIEKLPSHIGERGNPMLDVEGCRESAFARHPLPLDENFENLAASRFNPSHRRTLAKKRKKLQNKGRLEFALVDGREGREALELILEWRAKRFADENEAEEAKRVADFYRSLAEHTDIARIGRMTLDGVVIAGCFGTLTDETFQLLAVAHNGEFKNWSPGLLAIESSIAQLCAQGVTVYDFTIGSEPYKFDFGVEVEKLFEVKSSLTAKGALYMAALRGWQKIKVARAWWEPRRAAFAARLAALRPRKVEASVAATGEASRDEPTTRPVPVASTAEG
jgi:CelD/BcsL family acetyltransferase involved in cellulose biosynthesis